MVCLGNEQRSFCHFWDCIQVLHQTLLLVMRATNPSFSSKGFLPTVADIITIWIKFHPFCSILVHWFLKCWCSLLYLLFDHFQFTLIHGPNISGFYAISLFTALDLASIISHIHNWVLFFLWLHPFILSGVISPLISRGILGTSWPWEFLFQYPIILPFHTVYGVLKARILKWFAIPFSSGPCFIRTLHHDPSVLGGPTQHGSFSLS